jgi:hypothetical protein
VSIKLLKTSDFKTFLGITGTSEDAVIDLINELVSARIQTYCNRVFENPGTDVVEYPAGGSSILEPLQFPILSITSIKEDAQRQFAGSALDTSVYYQDGQVIHRTDGKKWLNIPGSIQLVYKAGYTKTAGVLDNVDDTIREAALLQMGFIYQRRRRLDVSNVSGGDGSIQTLERIDLLPEVTKALLPFKRGLV